MKRTLVTLALLILPAVALAGSDNKGRVNAEQKRALASYGKDVDVDLDERGVPGSMRGHLSTRIHKDPAAAASDALDLHRGAFRRGKDDEFAYRNHQDDALGQTHVRMGQRYRGLEVVGGELVVHMTKDDVIGINGRFVADLDLPSRASISDAHAASSAKDWSGRQGGRNIEVLEVGGDPVVYAGDLDNDPSLAVRVQVTYEDEEGVQIDDVFVNAESGEVVGKNPRVMYAKSRQIYNANQACVTTGNELPGTLMFSEGGSSADTGAMGAYNNTGTTYDYYKAIFNRDSYNNAGAVLRSSVHAQFNTGSSCTKNNAAWFDSLSQMAYGDGDGSQFTQLSLSLDVTAHELTHAVTSRTSNLAYQKESGALNEGASDIMGESTAFWSGTGGDWKIGAEVYTPGTSGDALRYMANPTQDGYSADYYPERLYAGTCTPSGNNDQCGVHGNSGIANLFYYLLSQGGTHPRGKTTVSVTGAGITAAQQIWYRALTVYMTSSTNFQGARTATSSAAADLYGGSCSATWQTVNKAWDAVGVPGTWSCGGGSTYPESAHNYTNNMDQTWTYTLAGSPASINVTFDALTKVEANYDYIYVMDKNNVNIAGSPFTNTTLAGATKNVPGDTVKIRLTSDASVVYYGFKVTNVTAGGATTYSISGNAGTTGATVSSGAASTTSDASSNYSFSGLTAGTYTITPSKAGCTFSPTSLSVTVGPNATGKNFTATCGGGSQQLLLNPGFESGNVNWTTSSGVITNSASQAAHGGTWKAWMNGYGTTHTDTAYQQVAIPSTATSATLTFWLHIDSAETTTTTQYDKLQVQVRNSAGTVLATLATYSNLNKATGYSQKSFNLTSYKGQTIRVYFLGTEDSSAQTSFVVDDTALNVQ